VCPRISWYGFVVTRVSGGWVFCAAAAAGAAGGAKDGSGAVVPAGRSAGVAKALPSSSFAFFSGAFSESALASAPSSSGRLRDSPVAVAAAGVAAVGAALAGALAAAAAFALKFLSLLCGYTCCGFGIGNVTWKPEHSTMSPRSGASTARSYTSRASTIAGSQTAREHSRGTPAPYATTSFQSYPEQVPFNPMYSRDSFSRSFSQSYQFNQPNQPIGFLPAPPAHANDFHSHPPTRALSNFSETIPLSQASPLERTFREFGEEKRDRSEQKQPQQQEQSPQRPQQFRPSPPPFCGTRSMRNPLLVDAPWSPPSPPSFHITLPKNSTYLDASNSYRPPPDLNVFRPAGFSQREKDLRKGVDERQVLLLG
jgi:hypothetical protein